MKVMPHPSVEGAHAAQARSAAGDWQRELHAARRLAWFHGPGEAAAGTPSDAPRRDVAVQPQADRAGAFAQTGAGARREAQRGATLAPWQPRPFALGGPSGAAHGAGATASSTPAQPQRAPASAGERATVGVGVGVGVVGPGGSTPARAAPAPAGRPGLVRAGLPDRAPASVPVRVHVEDGPQGVLVWLGVDGGAQGLRAGALATELRRAFAAFGHRLAGVVCNGTALQVQPASEREE